MHIYEVCGVKTSPKPMLYAYILPLILLLASSYSNTLEGTVLLITVIGVGVFFVIALVMYQVSQAKKASQIRRVRPVVAIPVYEEQRATAADALYDALQSAFGAKFDVLCDVHPSELENEQIDPGLTRTGSLNRHLFALSSKTTGEVKLVISLGNNKLQGRIARAAEDRRAMTVKLPIKDKYDVQEVRREILTQVRKLKAAKTSAPIQSKAQPGLQEPDMPREVIEVASTPPLLN